MCFIMELAMQQRPPPPRWPPPVPQGPWMKPHARPAFIPPLPPSPYGFTGPPRFYPQPPSGYFPHFVLPRPPRPPPRPPVVDAEQTWLDNFKRTHCSTASITKRDVDSSEEPPLRLMRRRVARALELADQLKVAAEELVSIENRLEELDAKTPEQQFVGERKAWSVEGPRLRVQRERKRAACEALKKELDAMNAASGLFPKQQLKQIRAFAARVNKKKAYRKRVKLRLRAEASICRAADTSTGADKAPTTESKLKPMTSTEGKQLCAEKPMSSPRSPNVPPVNRQATFYLSGKEGISPKQSLDPETLTFDALVAARRAWDSYIVVQRTPGASTIPPHFIPPPSTPSAQWAIYAYSS